LSPFDNYISSNVIIPKENGPQVDSTDNVSEANACSTEPHNYALALGIDKGQRETYHHTAKNSSSRRYLTQAPHCILIEDDEAWGVTTDSVSYQSKLPVQTHCVQVAVGEARLQTQ